MNPAIDKLVQQLTTLQLLSPAEAESALTQYRTAHSFVDEAVFAQWLVDRGRLTDYQRKELLAGRGSGLVYGDYIVEQLVGTGGMGLVYRARHRKLRRVVALKVLHANLSHSPDVVARFQREVQASGRLQHPNIVAALDAREQVGLYYLVMEFVDGIDLAHWIKQRGAMSLPAAIDCIWQAARGLEHAHGEGIIHRDIKPGNLLIDRQGTVKILDMGAARLDSLWGEPPDEDDNECLTHTGNILGTVDYMAPEQALDTRTADARADVYSLGCTLYRLLTTKKLYRRQTMLERILAHREAPIPRLSESLSDVPPRLEAMFQRMVAKRPEDRYASMSDLLHDLESLRVELGPPAWDLPATLFTMSGGAHDPEASAAVASSQAVNGSRALNAEQGEPRTQAGGDITQAAERNPPLESRAAPVQVVPVPATSGWVLPATIGSLVGLVVLTMLLAPSNSKVTKSLKSASKAAERNILKEEGWVADPAYSERTLERMRKELDSALQLWEQAQQRTRQEFDRQLDDERRKGEELIRQLLGEFDERELK